MNCDKLYDVAIIGAGPAGLAAAIDAQNSRLSYVIFESDTPLWFPKTMINQHVYVDGYMGFSNVTGTDLRHKMLEHVHDKNIEITSGTVDSVCRKGNVFNVTTKTHVYNANSIVLATGIRPIPLRIEGAEKFIGKQIFNFVDIDGYRFKNKKIIILGGRNSGATAALYIKRNISDDVLLIERADKLQTSIKYQEQLNQHNVRYMTATNVISFNGGDVLESVSAMYNNNVYTFPADAVFSYIGMKPCLPNLKGLNISITNYGEVAVNPATMETTVPGIYAVGDINNLRPKQVANACANGKTAIYYIAQKQALSR